MLIGFYFFGSETAQTTELTVDEMVPLVEEEGYRIITEEDYISLSLRNDNSSANDEEEEEGTEQADESEEDAEEEDYTEENDSNEESDEEENEEMEEEEEITTYTLNIEPGMTSSEFSSLLEENNIVEDASEFNQYIEDEDYSLRVQIGEFELTSDMTIYEIAEEITR
jgi:E3 ubiquitin-protein ligase DOA10